MIQHYADPLKHDNIDIICLKMYILLELRYRVYTINFKHSVEIRPLKSYSDLDLEATMLNMEIISAIFVYYNILKTVIMMLLSVKRAP